MQDGPYAEVGACPGMDVAAEDDIGCHRRTVFNDAVVRVMAVRQVVASATDRSCAPRAVVDAHILAKLVAVADPHSVLVDVVITCRRLAPRGGMRSGPVLAGRSDGDVRTDPIAVTDPRGTHDHRERTDDVVVAEFDTLAEDSCRVDAVCQRGVPFVSAEFRLFPLSYSLGSTVWLAPGSVWPALLGRLSIAVGRGRWSLALVAVAAYCSASDAAMGAPPPARCGKELLTTTMRIARPSAGLRHGHSESSTRSRIPCSTAIVGSQPRTSRARVMSAARR